MSDQSAQEREWIQAWKRADANLQRMRFQRLRQFDYQQEHDQIMGLLELGYRFRKPRESSGLVQMQQILKKART